MRSKFTETLIMRWIVQLHREVDRLTMRAHYVTNLEVLFIRKHRDNGAGVFNTALPQLVQRQAADEVNLNIRLHGLLNLRVSVCDLDLPTM